MQEEGGTMAVIQPNVAGYRPSSAPATPLEDLVTRMRDGDRDAAAEFTASYGPLIRRRVRGKLGPTMRRLFDSQEILSTLSRRLDRYVKFGRVEAATEPQLWALVFRMVDAALIDRIRLTKRLKSVEGEDSVFARTLLARLDESAVRSEDGVESRVDGALRSLDSVTDRQILSLWLMGNSQRVIADCVSMSYDMVRQRWKTIREQLRASIEAGEL